MPGFVDHKVLTTDRTQHTCREAGAQRSGAGQGRSAGEAHASSLTRSWLRWEAGVQRAATRDAARQRLAAVLETYTDVTRFPRCFF
jgi:hypothetical protein